MCAIKGKEAKKFPNTSEHSFIVNEDIRGMKVPKKLDRAYYISLAKNRLEGFGISDQIRLEL